LSVFLPKKLTAPDEDTPPTTTTDTPSDENSPASDTSPSLESELGNWKIPLPKGRMNHGTNGVPRSISPQKAAMWRVLNELGVPEGERPSMLRDDVVAVSREDELGQIRVKRITGIVDSPARKVMQQFERDVGRQGLIEGLSAVEDRLGPREKKMLE